MVRPSPTAKPQRDGRLIAAARRLRWRLDRLVFGRLFGRPARALVAGRADRLLRHVPIEPRWTRRTPRPPHGPWAAYERATPDSLRSQPGIARDPAAEDEAARNDPVNTFPPDTTVWAIGLNLRMVWTQLPTFAREKAQTLASLHRRPATRPRPQTPEELTRDFRAEAARLGMSAVGVAPFDARYQYEDFRGTEQGDRMVVGLLEEDHGSVQQMPGPAALKTTFMTISEGNRMMYELAEWLSERGYRAFVAENMAVVIPYAVAAGLGQLGLNGQLLTPQAGSRCRPTMLSTDAPLVLDAPRDFGVPRICDACQVCVARCPSGAIPNRRWLYRGVEKAKINTARCLPVVSQAYGCAVCMRVCPVQKYGLAAVVDEYERSGAILGKGTSELESYVWPVDGETYGPGRTPRLTREFLEPDGLDYRPAYVKPPPPA